VRAVHLLPPSAARGLLRVAGSGGLFGYFGRYWSRDLGGFRLMATRRTGLVLVETSGGRVVLSPGEPAAFREAVLGAAPWIARAPALALTPSGSPGRAVALVVALVLTLLGVGLGLAIGWSPTGAIVDAGDIRISRRLAPTVVIPLSEVRRISLLPPGQARGWRRTSGTSFGQVRYGRFESEALGPFRLYAWRGGPYLLLETDDGPVVLTPDDPEGFAAQARAGAGLER